MDRKARDHAVSDTRFPLVGEDGKPWVEGQKFVDPNFDKPALKGKYLVEHYPIPGAAIIDAKGKDEPLTPEEQQKVLDSTLRSIKGLIKDFQQRFLHYVDRGYNVTKTTPAKLDSYINEERQLLKNDNMPGGETELTKRWLVTALYGRSMMNAKYHIRLRADGEVPTAESVTRFHDVAVEGTKLKMEHRYKNDPERRDAETRTAIAELDQLQASALKEIKKPSGPKSKQSYLPLIEKAVALDMDEVRTVGVQLRQKRGYVTSSIEAMLGEPEKLFIASTLDDPKDRVNFLRMFFEGRYDKISAAQLNIDETKAATADVVAFITDLNKSSPSASKADAPDFKTAFTEMAEAAKGKMRVHHGSKAYPEADKKYIAARDEVQGMIDQRMKELTAEQAGPDSHVQKANGKKAVSEIRALNCLKQATDQIYDIAVTREANPTGLEHLKLEIKAADLPQGHKRFTS